MKRIRRHKEEAPNAVSVSKNNCIYPVVFPDTRELKQYRLPNGVEVRGIADLDNKGDINYAIGFGGVSLNGKELGGLHKLDGRVLYGILAYFQKNIRTRINSGKFTGKDDEYTVTFKSIYELLKFLNIPTNNPAYYDRVKEALYKIKNTSLHFCKGHYDAEKKAFSSLYKSFNIFDSLLIKETVNYESGKRLCSIELRISKDWYNTNNDYYITAGVDLYSKFSEAEVNLWLHLEQWNEEMLHNRKTVARNIRKLSTKIGYGDRPTKKLKEALKNAVKSINKKERKRYIIEFKDDNIIFSI